MLARKKNQRPVAGGAVLDPREIERMAALFKLLSDPTRLRILQVICQAERSVGEIVTLTGSGQANVSKHLALLTAHGVTARRREGLQIFYRVTEPLILVLCRTVKKTSFSKRG